MLIIVMGLPGSGKTYFAKALAEKIGCLRFNSDLIRKQLTRDPSYAADDKATVYKTMFNMTCQALQQGETVVVDATFSKYKYRSPYFDFTIINDIPLKIIMIDADEATIEQRLQKKRPDSDADFTIYKKIEAEFEPLYEDHLDLRSDELSLEVMIEHALEFTQTPNIWS